MKIPIKKYVMDESLSWEERYRQLEKHHEEETTWMMQQIKELEKPPYARTKRTKSEDIDKKIAEGIEFPIRELHGLELRGLLGDIVREISIEPSEEPHTYDARVVIVARCVESGHPDRDVILETPVRVNPDEINPKLTAEQSIAITLLQHILNHEIYEDLRIKGEHLLPGAHEF